MEGYLESQKREILDMISPNFQPSKIFCSANDDLLSVEMQLNRQAMDFPLIAKPNIGERGAQVEKIADREGLGRMLLQPKTHISYRHS